MQHSILRSSPLFAGIDEGDLPALLTCLSTTRKQYEKQAFILLAGTEARAVGIVLSGSAHVLQEDFWGNRTILAHIGPGGLFGEAFACAQEMALPVSVQAAQKAEVLFMDYKKIVNTCSNACRFHMLLIKNMLRILAQKNIMLTGKMEFLNNRTTRKKLIAYLSHEATRQNARVFSIPFNQQELADYLNVNRSALSREISAMQQDGMLRHDRSRFELLEQP